MLSIDSAKKNKKNNQTFHIKAKEKTNTAKEID